MIGVDCGTYNLVSCKRDKDKNFDVNREINAFVKIRTQNKFLFNLLKDKDVPIIDKGDFAYVLGQAAIDMALTMDDVQLQRPMQDGCVNPNEKEAYEILNSMIHGLIDEEVTKNKETLYYCVPANAINESTDAIFHQKLLQGIFDAYESAEGFKVSAHPINEALALIYAELGERNYTGIGVSCGAGMVNVCHAIYGVPAYQFSIVNSGDWIDKMAANACHESVAFINQEKTKIDLSITPKNMIERAIQTQYRIMIEHTVQGIKEGLDKSGKKNSIKPVDIVVAGGTSMPKGFDVLFSEILVQANLPITVSSIVRPADPLYSVARGCLIAAENAN